jgi:hypothetical protein
MEEKRMPFGKRLKCGNFLVLKYTRTLSKGEMKTLRDTMGIPQDMRKYLHRGGLPYIRVEALTGIWAIEFCCNTQMFMTIDQLLPVAIDAANNDEEAETTVADFAHLFALMMTDTMVIGDGEYQKAKAEAMRDLIDRQKPLEGDDKEILEEMQKEEEALAAVVDMAKEVSKQVDK